MFTEQELLQERWKEIPGYPHYEVGRKLSKICVIFNDGVKNYYLGQDEAARELGVSRSSISRWLNDCNNIELSSVEYVSEIPEGWKNTPRQLNKNYQVCVEYWSKPTQYFKDCREGDRALGLTEGTLNRWTKRTFNKERKGKAASLGIKKVYYVLCRMK
jgi:hypothetical protein